MLHGRRSAALGTGGAIDSRKAKAAIVIGILLALFLAIGAFGNPPPEEQAAENGPLADETTTEATTTEPGTTTDETTTVEEPPPPPLPVVARVLDGDTIHLDNGERVRLVQIDASELRGGECYARQSAAALRRLLPRGTEVRLEADRRLDRTDRFGRQLRYVWTGDTSVNLMLVRRGAASVWFFEGDRGRYAKSLMAAARVRRDEAHTVRSANDSEATATAGGRAGRRGARLELRPQLQRCLRTAVSARR